MITIKNKVFSSEKTLVTVPLLSDDITLIRKEIDYIKTSNIDVIEWRADSFKDLCYDSIVNCLIELNNKLNLPIIFTLRIKSEGGMADISDYNRIELIKKIIKTKLIDIVDIEYINGQTILDEVISVAHSNNVYVIVSNHNFENTPDKDNILNILEKIKSTNADIIKIAYMPKNKLDVLNQLEASIKFNKEDKLLISISMGELGKLTRVFPEFAGSCITFAKTVNNSALGQIDERDLCSMRNILFK